MVSSDVLRGLLYLKLGIFGHLSHSLPHPKITQDIFSATQKRIKGHGAVIMLDEMSHPCLCDAASSENLDGVRRGRLGAFGGVHFEQADRAGEFLGLFFV